MSRTPPAGELGSLTGRLDGSEKRLGDIERFDGAQYARALEQIRSLIAGLDAQVAAAIAANSYTKSQLDAKFADVYAQITALTTALVGVDRLAGIVPAAKGGTGTANVHSTTGTGTQKQVFVQPDGLLTTGASSERYKQDIEVLTLDVAAFMSIRPSHFRWRSEVDDDCSEAPLDLGFIAEQLHAAGLTEMVMYDDEGRPDAVYYNRMSVALHRVVQKMWVAQNQILATQADILDRVSALEAGK